jgi:hypothetical protein
MPDADNDSSTARKTTQSALRGCRVCNRRRIKCDGARPACAKCVSRGLQCPGYRKALKWICGPASKGPNSLSFRMVPAHPCPHQAANSSVVFPLVNPSSLPVVLSDHRQLPSLLSSTPIRGIESLLMQHFLDVVSIQLAWFEEESNPWRRLVLPLALESLGPSSSSYSLLTAILGVSASNIASRLAEGDAQRDLYLRITDSLRTKAFRFLSENLRVLQEGLQPATPPPPQRLIQTVVASVLLLSYLEVHWPSSGMWRFHLQTAQNISNMLQFAATDDATNAFLSEELCTASTWPLLTHCPSNEMSMNPELYNESRPGQEINGHSPFMAFVAIMRRVTQARRYIERRDVDPVRERSVLSKIGQQALLDLEQAYNMVLIESSKIRHVNGHDFQRIITAYYHATQIYCHQTLSAAVPDLGEHSCAWTDRVTLPRLRAHLVDSLLSLDNPDSLAQSQPWPLFILATVSTHDPVTQCWVESRMKCIMTLYCEIDRPQMLKFLRSFWSQAAYSNWIEYIWPWTKDHEEFLIL